MCTFAPTYYTAVRCALRTLRIQVLCPGLYKFQVDKGDKQHKEFKVFKHFKTDKLA